MKRVSIDENMDETEKNHQISTSNTVNNNKTNTYKAMENTEVNMKNYFDKVYRSSVDVDDLNTKFKAITISENHQIITSNTMNNNKTNMYKAMENTEVNMEDYFDKVYHGHVDVDDLNINFKVITISEEDLFSNFKETEQYIKSYAEFKEFKTRLGWSTIIEMKSEEKIMQKRTILCCHAGQYQPVNPIKSEKSNKIECQ
ncbi:12943_t:CDS:1 [Dentiscutata erythropus]|uniref:12943_t:CDS:1 n=1 Tax=Dentiscutata erythropus TaxID=1348616 RepID=A0A9N9H7W8_9GLOM|nr:12943_t:CDS:1 [Dentiscutata erythropus]